MSTEHRKPVVAFVALAVIAAALVGIQRAEARGGGMIAAVLGAAVHVDGALPGTAEQPAPGFAPVVLTAPPFLTGHETAPSAGDGPHATGPGPAADQGEVEGRPVSRPRGPEAAPRAPSTGRAAARASRGSLRRAVSGASRGTPRRATGEVRSAAERTGSAGRGRPAVDPRRGSRGQGVRARSGTGQPRLPRR